MGPTVPHKSQVRLTGPGPRGGLWAAGPLVNVSSGELVLGTHGYSEFDVSAAFPPCSSLLHLWALGHLGT